MAGNFAINTEELNDEVHLSLNELRHLVSRVEMAAKRARRGQVLRIKVSPDICLVFKNVDTMTGALPILGSKFETPEAPENCETLRLNS
jgi:hypothetical protein